MTITHLMLSGGGTNGVQIIGSLKQLYEENLINDLKVLSGVSVGSVISTLLCIYDINYIEENTYPAFNLFKFNIKTLLNKFGICSKEPYLNYIENLLIKKLNKSPTFQELHHQTEKELIIFATNVSKSKLVDFNYKTHPEMNVIDAIKLSMNVPIIFEYEEFDQDVYVDGGVISNFPFEYFSNIKNENKLGISTSYNKCQKDFKVNNIFSYIYHILNICIKKSYSYDESSVISLECSLSNLFNFKMTQDLFETLILLGKNQTELYLKNNNYI